MEVGKRCGFLWVSDGEVDNDGVDNVEDVHF